MRDTSIVLRERPHGDIVAQRLKPVLRFLLASLVFHSDTFLKCAHEQSPLRQIPLFHSPQLLQILRGMVTLKDENRLVPSGVPPHVKLMGDVNDVKQDLHVLTNLTRNLPDQITEKVSSSLNEISAQHGHITFDAVKVAINEALATNLQRFHLAPPTPASNSTDQYAPPQQTSSPLYQWGGRFRGVPESFVLPSVGIRHGWTLWWMGSPEGTDPIRPYRHLEGRDMPAAARRGLSEWKLVFHDTFEKLLDQNKWSFKDQVTMENVQRSFHQLQPFVKRLAKADTSERDPARPLDLHVITMARKIRVHQKESGGGERDTDEN